MKKFFYIWNSDNHNFLQTDLMTTIGEKKIWSRIQRYYFKELGYTPTAGSEDATIITELKSSKNRTLVYFME